MRRGALPTPAQAAARYAAITLCGGAAAGVAIEIATTSWMGAAIGAACLFVALGAHYGDTLRHTLPLHRALRRSERSDAERVPPSSAAVADAIAAPRRSFVVASASGGVAACLCALLEQPWSTRLAVFGAATWIAPALLVTTRDATRAWLFRFSPGEIGAEASADGDLPLGAALGVLGAGALTAAALQGWARYPMLGVAVLAAIAVHAITASAARAFTAERDRLRRDLEGDDPQASFEGLARGTRDLARLAEGLEARRSAAVAHALAEDATRKSVEDQGRQKTRLMASMSHDLRSPLNSILGFCELLEMGHDGPLTSGQRESLGAIAKSGRELLDLLNDILDSARSSAGLVTLRREWTPSVEILTEAVRRGQELIRGTDLAIEPVLEPGLPPLYVDRERIVQAVTGLLRHATRTMEQGSIRLYARVAREDGTEDQVHVDVIDRGGGFKEADRARLFQAFRAITSPSGRRIDGVGLTLSLVRDLAEAHGGGVWFEIEEGRGTRFTIALPTTGPDPAE